MAERMEGPRAKIERAKKHVGDLGAEIRDYAGRNPHEIVREVDPDSGKQLYRVRVREEPPMRWSAILGDAIHTLRSSLDLLACQLVLANHGSVGVHTGFPINRSGKDFETGGLAKVNGASQEAIKLLRAVKPYQGGNDALWRLHRLDIADKHRLIIPVGAAYHSFILNEVMQVPWQDEPVQIPPIAIRPADSLFPLKDGDIVFAADTPADEHNTQFVFSVAFGEGEIVEGEPLIPTLNQLGSAVEEIVELFAPLL